MSSLRTERGRVLRAELKEIESGAATPEEQTAAYVEALKRERSGWLSRLKAAQALGDDHEVFLGSGLNGARLRSEKTGLELAEEAEQNIAAVNAELERVGGD